MQDLKRKVPEIKNPDQRIHLRKMVLYKLDNAKHEQKMQKEHVELLEEYIELLKEEIEYFEIELSDMEEELVEANEELVEHNKKVKKWERDKKTVLEYH